MLQFACKTNNGVTSITAPSWHDIPHGIIGQNGALPGALLLKQVHGNQLIALPHQALLTAPARSVEGDGFIASISGASPGTTIAIAAADCAPILLRCGGTLALVHAGWRGLAAGIVESAVRELAVRSGRGGTIEALVGPCAHWCCYEVGQEVVTALGKNSCHRETHGDASKKLLSIGRSAASAVSHAIHALGSSWTSALAYVEICTICDQRFHSFRRDGASAGRNLAYFVL